MTTLAMTGATGKLGRYFLDENVLPLDCDITNLETIVGAVNKLRPDVIIHLASLSDANECEKEENQAKVIATNLVGTANLLEVAEKLDATVVMLSTDHVFSGKRGWLPPYTEKSTPDPVNFYGHSKLAAESLYPAFPNLKVIRTSYLFDKARLDDTVSHTSVPAFMYRSFMYIPHFVRSFMQYVYNIADMPPLLHLSGSKTVSWRDFLDEYAGRGNYRFHTKDDKRYAPRPKWGGLRTIYPFFPKRDYLQGIRELRKANV